ncbi:MAG: hypothetical protein NC390_08230 [Fusobacterium sp.]|nr:hypothetical protein [Fusobacterium sp.]
MRIQPFQSVNNIKSFVPLQNRSAINVNTNNQDKDVFVKLNDISFGCNLPITAKLNSFVPEVSHYILHADEVTLKGLEKVVQKTSPQTAVKSLKEIPVGANVNDRTGAYFHCLYNFTRDLSDVIPGTKAIYINDARPDSTKSRLELLCDVVHEMTHIFQEEASDRTGKLELLQKLLSKNLSFEAKKDTLMSMPQTFAFCDMEFQRPLIYSLKKDDNLPRPVREIRMEALDAIYNNTVNCPADNYIVGIINKALKTSVARFPNADMQTVINYITTTAKCEREAYDTSLKVLKSVLGVKSPTDLEYRIALYDRFSAISQAFEDTIGRM